MDQKLSALTELAAKPAACDEIYIRDESEVPCCESKRIKPGNLLSFYDCATATLTNKTLVPACNTLTLTNTNILVGNGSNVGVDVAVSGDATLANTGALTVAGTHAGTAHHVQITDGNALTFCSTTLNFDGGAAPGGQLGGTWACPTVDASHSGSAHHTLVTTSGSSTLLSISTQDIVVADNWDVAGTLDVTGALVADSTLNVAGLTTLAVAGNPLIVQNTTDDASNTVAVFRGGNRACPANNDQIILSFQLDDACGDPYEFAGINIIANDVGPAGQEDGAMLFRHVRNNVSREWLRVINDEVVVNDASVNLDFRVEGNGNANMLVIDAGLDVVAIGGAAVSGKMLSVYGDVSVITGNRIELGAITARAGCGAVNPTNALNIFNGTIPVGTLANGATLYTKDVSCSAELHVMDEAGNESLLSPHCPTDNSWIFHSKDINNKVLHVDMEKMMKAINDEFGWDFVKEYICLR